MTLGTKPRSRITSMPRPTGHGAHLNKKNKELASKLVAEERARLSAEAGLKNVKDQAKDQHKKLHLTEIELATQRQLVLELKAKLQKAKEAAQVAKEVSEIVETASYERRV